MHCGHYYHWYKYKNNKRIIGDDMEILEGIIGNFKNIIGASLVSGYRDGCEII